MTPLSFDQTQPVTTNLSKTRLWTGWILSGLSGAFLLMDAVMKLVKPAFVVDSTVQLGWPASVIVPLGVVLLLSTVLYLIPHTAFFGAILLTGYLGGAVATHVRVAGPVFNMFFPVLFGFVLWQASSCATDVWLFGKVDTIWLSLRNMSCEFGMLTDWLAFHGSSTARCRSKRARSKIGIFSTREVCSMSKATTEARGLDLILTSFIEASPDKLFRAWTEPELMKQWFAPKPFTTSRAETDPRPGGASLIVMQGPDGTEFPCHGVYLEVVPNERLVFTDAYTRAWEPSEKPFMTVIVTFEAKDGGTLYTEVARHWTEADREAHEKMGFHEGWAMCTEQLAQLVSKM